MHGRRVGIGLGSAASLADGDPSGVQAKSDEYLHRVLGAQPAAALGPGLSRVDVAAAMTPQRALAGALAVRFANCWASGLPVARRCG
jgi:hypothetical protein